MLHLFVGDIFDQVAHRAKQVNTNAYLVDHTNSHTASGVVYTSIADMQSIDAFFELCKKAHKITYCPPENWSDIDNKGYSKQKYYTELLLHYFSQFIDIENLPKTKRDFLKQSFLVDQRKSHSKQIWIAGCSCTSAVGVNRADTWKEKVSEHFNLPYSDLSMEGSSISWASDQILLSDIRSDDIVFWQLTAHERFPFILDNKLKNILVSNYDKAQIQSFIGVDYLTSDTLYYNNTQAVRKVYNFCNKVGAQLVIIDSVMYDWESNWVTLNVPCYKKLLVWPMKYIDYGTDKLHPGPLHHKKMADEFIRFYFELYQNFKKG